MLAHTDCLHRVAKEACPLTAVSACGGQLGTQSAQTNPASHKKHLHIPLLVIQLNAQAAVTEWSQLRGREAKVAILGIAPVHRNAPLPLPGRCADYIISSGCTAPPPPCGVHPVTPNFLTHTQSLATHHSLAALVGVPHVKRKSSCEWCWSVACGQGRSVSPGLPVV